MGTLYIIMLRHRAPMLLRSVSHEALSVQVVPRLRRFKSWEHTQAVPRMKSFEIEDAPKVHHKSHTLTEILPHTLLGAIIGGALLGPPGLVIGAAKGSLSGAVMAHPKFKVYRAKAE